MLYDSHCCFCSFFDILSIFIWYFYISLARSFFYEGEGRESINFVYNSFNLDSKGFEGGEVSSTSVIA